MKQVLVLGSGGMLGSMVLDYLKKNSTCNVTGSTRTDFDAEAYTAGIPQRTELKADYIINCIGVIKPFCKDNDALGVKRAIAINALFPHRLADAAKSNGSKVIQIATDCVFSGKKGNYLEGDTTDPLDVYGKTKSLGEVFGNSLLNIRSSFIGPEQKNKVNLLEWFLNQPDGSTLNGYAHHRWNGATTLQIAKLIHKIIDSHDHYERLLSISSTHHFVLNESVTKFDLLNLMNEVFCKNFTIKQVTDQGPPVDRTLATRFAILNDVFGCKSIPMKDALIELRNYKR